MGWPNNYFRTTLTKNQGLFQATANFNTSTGLEFLFSFSRTLQDPWETWKLHAQNSIQFISGSTHFKAISLFTAEDADYCYQCSVVCVFVCLLVTIVRCAKMAESFEMQFKVWTCWGGAGTMCLVTRLKVLYYYYYLFTLGSIWHWQMTKIRSITEYYKIRWSDVPPHQQSSHEAELHWSIEATRSTTVKESCLLEFIIIFLTPVLNSQGIKKLRYALQ